MDLRVPLNLAYNYVLCRNNILVGRELNEEEKCELVAAATYMHIKKEELARQFINQDRYNYIIILVTYNIILCTCTRGKVRVISFSVINHTKLPDLNI